MFLHSGIRMLSARDCFFCELIEQVVQCMRMFQPNKLYGMHQYYQLRMYKAVPFTTVQSPSTL